jgi:hypothetical protein
MALAFLAALGVLVAPLVAFAAWGMDTLGLVFLPPFAGIALAYACMLYVLFLHVGAAVLSAREPDLIVLFTLSPN